MEIPYTLEARPDTGLHNSKLGIWLFLASEVMLFGALFSTYILLRSGSLADAWPIGSDILNVPLGTFNTIILIISSITMVMSWVSLKLNDLSKYKVYMGATIFLGILFLFVKFFFEYLPKFEHHMYPGNSTYLAIYFTMTGLHALHVLGGVLVNLYLWLPATTNLYKCENNEQLINRVEVAGLYWHFVDLVWIFLFPTLYLL